MCVRLFIYFIIYLFFVFFLYFSFLVMYTLSIILILYIATFSIIFFFYWLSLFYNTLFIRVLLLFDRMWVLMQFFYEYYIQKKGWFSFYIPNNAHELLMTFHYDNNKSTRLLYKAHIYKPTLNRVIMSKYDNRRMIDGFCTGIMVGIITTILLVL